MENQRKRSAWDRSNVLTAACLLALAMLMAVSSRNVLIAENAATGGGKLRIGFVDQALPGSPTPRNAAALSFVESRGKAVRLRWDAPHGWRDAGNKLLAPEEFDVVWFHQADDPNAAVLPEAAIGDLSEYVEFGGVLLLSGAAGRLVNDLGVESTTVRLLGPTSDAYLSGIHVVEKHRNHPAFAGLNAASLIPLTTLGGNAFADFYGTDGPHGDVLADGNAGVGERPLVEYVFGSGRIILVGWRLPDFTTATDLHRPNLERLFSNLLHYLADHNANRGRMIRPAGEYRYMRLDGVPLLRAAKAAQLGATRETGERSAVIVSEIAASKNDIAVGDLHLRERPADGVPAHALALTLLRREKPLSRFISTRHAQQAKDDRSDNEKIHGLRVVKPAIALVTAPLKPLQMPELEQSVLLGRSPFQAPGEGRGDVQPMYEPVEDGGFRIRGGARQLNRPIIHGQNRVWTGDVPIFRIDTTTGNGTYSADKVFPLWPRSDIQSGSAYPSMGTLRLAVPDADGKPMWLDALRRVTTTFRPGYTEYEVEQPQGQWTAHILVAPTMDFHGMVCRVQFDRPQPLRCRYGGMWWLESEANSNRVELAENYARISEPKLPGGLVVVGWDGPGSARIGKAAFGQEVEFDSGRDARSTYHFCATWGVQSYDKAYARTVMARLDRPAAPWSQARDRLKKSWFDCYIKPAIDPESHFKTLVAAPSVALERTKAWWDRRRDEFQVRAPDAHLNALANWSRCTTEYHRQGPGLVLGCQYWIMYSHISTGWYGKEWGGDHQALDECLRLYAAMQAESGAIPWVSPSLTAFEPENNTPYWVDHVWWHFAWTGDRQFVRDLWPNVRKAVAWQRKHNDPDGDGLFRDFYEYWNCDSNGKGPKAAAPSAMSWAMLDRAARLAHVVGDAEAEKEYRALADKTRQAIFRELWREDAGRLGSIGGEGMWRGHPQTWEEYLAVNAGLLSPAQGRRAMRWLESHYGFEPQPGVHLLASSDWFPIRWSTQWVPTGDSLLAAMAGMKSGDVDLWWPYMRTVLLSAFKSEFPGINMGIANTGAGGGDREDVDSVDPHVHAVVRGLFGIGPALHENRLDITSAFPSAWRAASIRTPDVSYEYRREGNLATFHIRTPRPVAKHVRANLTGSETVTPLEKESVPTIALGPSVPPVPVRKHPPTILAEQQPPDAADVGLPLTPAERGRQVLFDLSATCNVTAEEFSATKFLFDYRINGTVAGPGTTDLQTIPDWWGNPTLRMKPSPRVVEAATGVVFLTAGRPRSGLGPAPKDRVALSSWQPYPLPAAAKIPIGMRCTRVWLLLQNYVHPIKNYIPNGEVVLKYADGHQAIESLVPPLNLDCYFQHFSRKGTPIALGTLGPAGYIASPCFSHADALEIRCEPNAVLETIVLRATCSEGVLGLVGLTAITP
jgi:hypothetical protein